MKSIIKEIFIILLLIITICLIFGVIFYDYIPTNKVVPSTVEAYETSNTIKDEISQEIVESPKQNITFEITDSELNIRKQDNTYVSGKANPFAAISANPNDGNTNNNINQNKNPDSSNHFFNDLSEIK